MKGGITKKIEDTISALDKGQLKKALYLTEGHEKLSHHHQFVKEAARICLANKDDKETCQAAINEARNKIQDTVSLPIDDTSLDGLEDYLKEDKPMELQTKVMPENQKSPGEMSDEELYENCEICHVAVAAARIADICAEKPEEADGCELIGRSLANENTEPADWIKAMVQTAENAHGKAKEEMAGAITELIEYLEQRSSPLMEQLDKEGGDD